MFSGIAGGSFHSYLFKGIPESNILLKVWGKEPRGDERARGAR